MRSFILNSTAILGLFFSFQASAATIEKAIYEAESNALVLTVSYGGGCEDHDFSLELVACRETFPVQCDFNLIEDTHGDVCDAYITEEVIVTLSEAGLDDPYYNGARLTISGDGDSSAEVRLPLR